MDIRIFTEDEITEINLYVANQIPQSVLPQLLIITEEPLKKIKVFVTVYRIIQSARDFVENKETKDKLTSFLLYGEKAYDNIYNSLLLYENHSLNFGKSKKLKNLMLNLTIFNEIINKFTNNFLVFAEKQELLNIDKIAGLSLDNDEGKDVYDKILKNI